MNTEQVTERESSGSGKRVLIVKLSALGDLFHALPAVHNLKLELGVAIDWCTQVEYADLVRCFTDVNRVIAFPRRGLVSGFGAFRRDLRSETYDLVVDLQGLLKSAFVTMLARGKRKIGPSFHREGSSFFYSETAGLPNKNRHAVAENLDIIRHLGLKALKPEFPVAFPEIEATGNRPRIGLLPVSRWPTKNWPIGCFANTALKLKKMRNASFHILGGAGDARICSDLATMIGEGAVNHAGKLSLVEAGGLLKNLDLLIANDSGPVHMATSVGTPTVVIFGPTDPVRTGPYGPAHRVAHVRLPCKPCFSRYCKTGTSSCLEGVTPEHVTEVAMEILG